MDDPPESSDISPQNPLVVDHVSPDSLPEIENTGSRVKEDESTHSDQAASETIDHSMEGTVSAEVDECTTKEHSNENRETDKRDSLSPTYTDAAQESSGGMQDVNDIIPNDVVTPAESTDHVEAPTAPEIGEEEPASVQPEACTVDVTENGVMEDLTQEATKSDDGDNGTSEYPIDRETTELNGSPVESGFQANGLASETPEASQYVNDSPHAEYGDICDQGDHTDTASPEEVIAESGEMSQDFTQPYVENENVAHTDAAAVHNQPGESDENSKPLSLDVAPPPDSSEDPASEGTLGEADKLPDLNQGTEVESVESMDVTDREDKPSESRERQFSEELNNEQHLDTLSEEVAASAEVNNNQDYEHFREEDEDDQLCVRGDSPSSTDENKTIGFASPHTKENEKSATFASDLSNAEETTGGVGTGKGTADGQASLSDTTYETSNLLTDMSDGDLVHSTNAENILPPGSAVKCEDDTGDAANEPITAEDISDWNEAKPPGETDYQITASIEPLTEPETIGDEDEEREPSHLNGTYTYRTDSETEVKEHTLGEENEGSEGLFHASVENGSLEISKILRTDSSSMHENFATEHHATGYLESETEFHILPENTATLSSFSEQENPFAQAAPVVVDSSEVTPLRTWNKPDYVTVEKHEAKLASIPQHATHVEEVTPEKISPFSAVVHSTPFEGKENLKANHLKQTEIGAPIRDTTSGAIDFDRYLERTSDLSAMESKQRSRTLDSALMSSWTNSSIDPRRRAATLGRNGSHRRRKLMPKPAVNDDHLFPDSVTPSKVDRELSMRSLSVGLPEGTYDVPYIDDDAFLPRSRHGPQNRNEIANGSEYSSEEGDWNWSNAEMQNELLTPAHIADVNECIPTPESTPQQQRISSKRKREKGRELIDGKKAKGPRKRRPFHLCNCVGRQSQK